MFDLARLGDTCDHGAVIITATSKKVVEGKDVARIGDLVSCPIPGHGVNPIVASVAAPVLEGGKDCAHIASITACGAVIITGASKTRIDR